MMALLPLVLLGLACAAVSQDPQIYAAGGRTKKGCVCKDECVTSAAFYCHAAPVCAVVDKDCPGGTANYSATKGYWDVCDFHPFEPYEKLSAAEKQAMLLERIHAHKVHVDFPNPVAMMTGLMTESAKVSMEAQADVFPQPRRKYIHGVGAVAPIRWESVPGHSYGGLFATGAEHGLIRFSLTQPPTERSGLMPGMGFGNGFSPGVGVKLFRSGRPSANFLAMPSLDGQSCEESNFFRHDFNTHVPYAGSFVIQLVTSKFWQASTCPLMVGLSNLADGQGNFPYMLTLRPVAGLNVECPCKDYAKCVANLGVLAPGQALFEVLATAAPGAGPPELIGRISIGDLAPTVSEFGDMQLFFKHQYMEEDFQLHPEWLQQIDPEKDCGIKQAGTQPHATENGCSSPFSSKPLPSEDAECKDAQCTVAE